MEINGRFQRSSILYDLTRTHKKDKEPHKICHESRFRNIQKYPCRCICCHSYFPFNTKHFFQLYFILLVIPLSHMHVYGWRRLKVLCIPMEPRGVRLMNKIFCNITEKQWRLEALVCLNPEVILNKNRTVPCLIIENDAFPLTIYTWWSSTHRGTSSRTKGYSPSDSTGFK